jgi:hypothetical protein
MILVRLWLVLSHLLSLYFEGLMFKRMPWREIHDFFAGSPKLTIFASYKRKVKGTEAFPSLFDRQWQ